MPAIVASADRALNDAGPDGLICDAGNDPRSDLATVDFLARLAVAARRQGATVRIEHASPELLELLGLCGFEGVLEVAVESADDAAAAGSNPQSRWAGTPNSGK